MRKLGLDLGTKTIGVAVSDALGWTAQALETIPINEEKEEFGLLRLNEIVKEYDIDTVVLGYPKNMNGTIGPRGEASERFAQLLKEQFSGHIVLWDERLTTTAAEKMLISADVSRKKRKKVIDQIAAVFILQGYLDSKQ